MVKKTPDYSKGKIYGVYDKRSDQLLYIGSTVMSLALRMCEHRSASRKQTKGRPLSEHMTEHGIHNFRIGLIESCPCDNIDELKMHEHRQIIKAKESGIVLLNKKTAYSGIPSGTDKKEYRKLYNQKHEDEMKEKAKEKVYCNICDTYVRKHELKRHEARMIHQRNLRGESTPKSTDSVYCEACCITLMNRKEFREHLKTKKHSASLYLSRCDMKLNSDN